MNLIIIIFVAPVVDFVVEAVVFIIGSAEKMRVFLVQFMNFFLLAGRSFFNWVLVALGPDIRYTISSALLFPFIGR